MLPFAERKKETLANIVVTNYWNSRREKEILPKFGCDRDCDVRRCEKCCPVQKSNSPLNSNGFGWIQIVSTGFERINQISWNRQSSSERQGASKRPKVLLSCGLEIDCDFWRFPSPGWPPRYLREIKIRSAPFSAEWAAPNEKLISSVFISYKSSSIAAASERVKFGGFKKLPLKKAICSRRF